MTGIIFFISLTFNHFLLYYWFSKEANNFVPPHHLFCVMETKANDIFNYLWGGAGTSGLGSSMRVGSTLAGSSIRVGSFFSGSLPPGRGVVGSGFLSGFAGVVG